MSVEDERHSTLRSVEATLVGSGMSMGRCGRQTPFLFFTLVLSSRNMQNRRLILGPNNTLVHAS